MELLKGELMTIFAAKTLLLTMFVAFCSTMGYAETLYFRLPFADDNLLSTDVPGSFFAEREPSQVFLGVPILERDVQLEDLIGGSTDPFDQVFSQAIDSIVNDDLAKWQELRGLDAKEDIIWSGYRTGDIGQCKITSRAEVNIRYTWKKGDEKFYLFDTPTPDEKFGVVSVALIDRSYILDRLPLDNIAEMVQISYYASLRGGSRDAFRVTNIRPACTHAISIKSGTDLKIPTGVSLQLTGSAVPWANPISENGVFRVEPIESPSEPSEYDRVAAFFREWAYSLDSISDYDELSLDDERAVSHLSLYTPYTREAIEKEHSDPDARRLEANMLPFANDALKNARIFFIAKITENDYMVYWLQRANARIEGVTFFPQHPYWLSSLAVSLCDDKLAASGGGERRDILTMFMDGAQVMQGLSDAIRAPIEFSRLMRIQNP